jgi:hypothetical protein
MFRKVEIELALQRLHCFSQLLALLIDIGMPTAKVFLNFFVVHFQKAQKPKEEKEEINFHEYDDDTESDNAQ